MSKRTKPPFRADHVGSLLRPVALKKAREKRAKDEITPAQLKEIEDREIERVIKKQEDVGLLSVTDGEFRRSWWHLDFLWGLDGIEKHIMDTGVAFAAVTTRNEGLKITGKVGFSRHPMIEHFKFVAAHTRRTPKITIPAPSAIYGRPMMTPINKQVYPELDRFFEDLGQAYKKAVRGFADAGCRFTHAFVASPSCAPSRAAILTSQYSHLNDKFDHALNGAPIAFIREIIGGTRQSGDQKFILSGTHGGHEDRRPGGQQA